MATAAGSSHLAAQARRLYVEELVRNLAPLVQSVVVSARVASPSRVFVGSTVTGRVAAAVSYTHLTLPTNREV